MGDLSRASDVQAQMMGTEQEELSTDPKSRKHPVSGQQQGFSFVGYHEGSTKLLF